MAVVTSGDLRSLLGSPAPAGPPPLDCGLRAERELPIPFLLGEC